MFSPTGVEVYLTLEDRQVENKVVQKKYAIMFLLSWFRVWNETALSTFRVDSAVYQVDLAVLER